MDTDLNSIGAVNAEEKTFDFTGDAKEYFSIWIVNVLLTILTLGIYSAWAKVRTNQYFYGNTHLDGNTFRYLADPKRILKGRVIAAAIFAVYYFSGLLSPTASLVVAAVIMLLMPAFVVMSMSFQLRNSAYRNIRFNFDKDYRRAYILFTVPVLMIVAYVSVISMFPPVEAGQAGEENIAEGALIMVSIIPLLVMLLFPWWEFLLNRFKISNASYGTEAFSFLAATGDYYKLYLKAFFIITFLGIGMAIVGGVIGGAAGVFFGVEDEARGAMGQSLSFLMPLLILPFYIWMFAYFQTKKTNLIYNNIEIDNHKVRSTLEVGKMFMLYLTNTIAMALSLGLMMPWAKIRTARYRASQTNVLANGNFDGFITAQVNQQSALGEEMGEVFDMDLGM